MIKSSDIITLLKDKKADLTKEEIEKIIEDELMKDEDKMDADLIEYCLDALKEIKPAKKKKPFSYIKVASCIAAAAVLIFVIVSAIPKLTNNHGNVVSTTAEQTEKATSPHIEKTTAQHTEKNSSVTASHDSDNLPTEASPTPSSKKETTDIPSSHKGSSTVTPEESFESVVKKLLSSHGFDGVLLPRRIFENAEILSKSFEENKAEMKVKSKEKIYGITIEKSLEKFNEENVIDVNGISVSVESRNNSAEIRYRKNNLNYRIVFESSYEEAVSVAKTIC